MDVLDERRCVPCFVFLEFTSPQLELVQLGDRYKPVSEFPRIDPLKLLLKS